jgi:D-alanine-D-alanine ligase
MINVGFTYDLYDDYIKMGFSREDAAEFDSIETIDAIDDALTANGFEVERVGGIQNLVKALAKGKRWDIVFNICEGVKGIGRESQVPALLEAYDLPAVFSASDVMTLTMNKALAKMAVRERGVPTAPFSVVEKMADVNEIDLSFPVFVKPLAEGTGKGITGKSLVNDKDSLRSICAEILMKYDQPALVETYLTGDDLTVGMLGQGASARAIGVMRTIYKQGAEHGAQTLYNKENWKKVLDYEMVSGPLKQAAEDVALRSWLALGCRDGGRIDLRCDAQGIPNFIEVNTLAGLRPHYSDLPMLADKSGMDFDHLIGNIMQEALARYSELSLPESKKRASGSSL